MLALSGTTMHLQVSCSLGSNALSWVLSGRPHDLSPTSELEKQSLRNVTGSLQREAGF